MGALRFPQFGERLGAAMRAAGYVNAAGEPDVPMFISRFGFDPRSFYPWLRGKRTPELDTLTRLAEILGVSRAWLLLGDGPGPEGYRSARRRRSPAPIAGGSGASVHLMNSTPPVGASLRSADPDASYQTWRRIWWYLLPTWTTTLAHA